jgi:hypothetical protein
MAPTNSSSSQSIGLPCFDGQALFGASHALASWVDGTSQIASEIGGFTRDRLKKDWETAARLASCGDPGGVFLCQCQAAETAVKDYLEEAGKLTRLVMDVALSAPRGDRDLPGQKRGS